MHPAHHTATSLEPLTISADGRRLITASGDPFFWLADTAWEMLHKLSRDETLFYLKDRASKGFNVIQTVILAELDGLYIPNFNGDVPLNDLDPTQPNERYFDHLNWVIAIAARLGLYLALLPSWGDKVEKRYEWAAGPEIFHPDNAFSFGRFLGERYGRKPNIIWVIGGDRDPGQKAVAVWRSMAEGIREGASGNHVPLMTFHAQPFEGGSSSRWFHADEWLSFNMLQTGHDRDTPVYKLIQHDYNRVPVKPVLDGEPLYEAHGIGFQPQQNGYSTDADIRKSAYWSVFSGAAGHTYGCHSVWQFHREEEKGINFPLYTWKEALQLSGALQMRWLRQLMMSVDPAGREPAQQAICGENPAGADHQTAMRERTGRYVWIYSPTGNTISVDGAILTGLVWRWRWFSPRDGRYTCWVLRERSEVAAFKPPSRGYGCDWVLIVEEAEGTTTENIRLTWIF